MDKAKATDTKALRELLAAADYEGRHLPTIDVEVKAIRALDDWESYLPALLDRLEELEEAAGKLGKAVAFLDQARRESKPGDGTLRDAREWLESAARDIVAPPPPAGKEGD